jgi:hypothetical protein
MSSFRFPQFANLPLELQREIWQASLDDAPEPGVYIIKSEDSTNGDPGFITIDTSYTPLMHVCRESRAMSRKQLRFHEIDRRGACLGPYRIFNPETDSVYVSVRDWGDFFDAESFESWTVPPAHLQHLALDARAIQDSGCMWKLTRFLGTLSGLQTLSIVFSEEGWVPRDHIPTGDLPYQLLDCAKGDAVWYAPPGRVKRQDMDPWEIADKFRRDFTRSYHSDYLQGRVPDWEHVPWDQEKAQFLFDFIPRRIVPKLLGMGPVKQRNLLSSIIGGLRGLLQS